MLLTFGRAFRSENGSRFREDRFPYRVVDDRLLFRGGALLEEARFLDGFAGNFLRHEARDAFVAFCAVADDVSHGFRSWQGCLSGWDMSSRR